MKFCLSITKGEDNYKSFEINDILKSLDNNVNDHMIQIVREFSIKKIYHHNIFNVSIIIQDHQKKNFVIYQIERIVTVYIMQLLQRYFILE